MTSVLEDDPLLDVLLDLDGQRFTLEPRGYFVKFTVKRVPGTPERPHGIGYALTLHSPEGDRLVGFDNAHAVRTSRGPAGGRRELDHRHRMGTTRAIPLSRRRSIARGFLARPLRGAR